MQRRLWWELWYDLAKSAFRQSMESDGRFRVGAFSRESGSVVLKLFSHLIYTKVNVTDVLSVRFAEINAAINCNYC
jgi:hypothetical protein